MTVTDASSQEIVKRLTKLPNVFEAEVTGLGLGHRYKVKVALDTSRGDGMFSNSTTVVTYNGNACAHTSACVHRMHVSVSAGCTIYVYVYLCVLLCV